VNTLDPNIVARASSPAKLNLFLEILGRRDDGYHEIDTVMVPIDWCDQLSVRRSEQAGVRLHVDWSPSLAEVAEELAVDPATAAGQQLLSIPADETNLVHRALTRFAATFGIGGGFECRLEKSIPAGAGMGGASSNAATALLCAAELCGIKASSAEIVRIAAEIGSDVPFFLGRQQQPTEQCTAMRARGRGERLTVVPVAKPLDFVVAYPAVSLSTAKVYADCQVPPKPQSPAELIGSLASANHEGITRELGNRLTNAAKKNAPQIDEILKSMWQAGLRTCQLTGSGSACFAVVRSQAEAKRFAEQLRQSFDSNQGCAKTDLAETIEPGNDLNRGEDRLGTRIKAARSGEVPPRVDLSDEASAGELA